MATRKKSLTSDYVRSSFFGIEDSLVSTTGLIAGIAAGSADKKFVLLAGVVAISVEAISMAAGEFLSEEATQDMGRGKRHSSSPLIGGIIMLVSYALAGLVPLIPVIFIPQPYTLPAAIGSALIGLYSLGYVRGRITKRPPVQQGLKVLIVGGLAAFIGIVVGLAFKL